MNEWADEEAGIEAVQRVLDAMDDIHALQDPYTEPEVLMDMLQDDKLHELLHVSKLKCSYKLYSIFVFYYY